VAPLERLAHGVDLERPLGDEDRVGAAGETRVGGDPAGVAPHHLDHDHAVVRFRRGVQAVDRVGRDLDSGVEAERDVGSGEVVVDRLRNADHAHTVRAQASGDAERVLAADRDQGVDAEPVERRPHRGRAIGVAGVGVRARGAEDRAAAGEDALRGLERELDGVAFEHARPSVPETNQLEVVVADALADDPADHGVQPGTVAATREHSDSHGQEPNGSAARGWS
jgi:hypothetical protein